MNRIKNTKAFTLIELVVVIVILGILAAIAAFAYQNFISNARANAVQRKADQVAKSLQGASASKQKVLTGAEVDAVLGTATGGEGLTKGASGDYNTTVATGDVVSNVTVRASNTSCVVTLTPPANFGPGDKMTRTESGC